MRPARGDGLPTAETVPQAAGVQAHRRLLARRHASSRSSYICSILYFLHQWRDDKAGADTATRARASRARQRAAGAHHTADHTRSPAYRLSRHRTSATRLVWRKNIRPALETQNGHGWV